MKWREVLCETKPVLDVYHGTNATRFKAIRPRMQYDAGYPAFFTTQDRRFASQFAFGKTGKLLHLKLDTNGFIDLNDPEHMQRLCTKLADLLTPLWRQPVTLPQAYEQLLIHVHNGRLDWAYHLGMKAAWQAGFAGVMTNDAHNVPSFLSFDATSLHVVDSLLPDAM